MYYHSAIDTLLLTEKLNLKFYVLYEAKELLTIPKMYITYITILIFIISIVIAIIINIITISITILFIAIDIMIVKDIIFTFQKQLSEGVPKYFRSPPIN